ncbi:hypothetical protein [Streptomyces sp. NPDC008317]|uniref:hypothetical protein n=1 Tax=Streptomyces sp. NPDC008317 TaxID=3364827 RepID=UPI0036E6A65E
MGSVLGSSRGLPKTGGAETPEHIDGKMLTLHRGWIRHHAELAQHFDVMLIFRAIEKLLVGKDIFDPGKGKASDDLGSVNQLCGLPVVRYPSCGELDAAVAELRDAGTVDLACGSDTVPLDPTPGLASGNDIEVMDVRSQTFRQEGPAAKDHHVAQVQVVFVDQNKKIMDEGMFKQVDVL